MHPQQLAARLASACVVDPPRITALTLAATRALAPAAFDRYLLPAPRLQQATDVYR